VEVQLNDMTGFAARRLTEMPLAELKPHKNNPRTHSKKQIGQIADSIRRFSFTNPVLVDDDHNIIAGHGRVEAAKTLGLTHVPTIALSGMSAADRKAYIIADNRLAECAGWDEDLLKLELAGIMELEPHYDLALTGFDGGTLERLIEAALSGNDVDDVIPAIDEKAVPVSASGELWCLGRHRLLCGDARDSDAYQRLMNGELAQMVFTDPPYNVPVNGHVCGLGKVKHAEFAMASGEMSQAEFEGFLTNVLGTVAEFSAEGSIHYVCMDWRHIREILAAGYASYEELKNLIVWNKDNGGMGAFYRSKHELVFAFKKGKASHINNFELGQHGRYRTNVWDYAGVNSLKAERSEELAMHPTVKPVAMVADAIRDCSKRNGIILDPFSGSGTTIVAAEQTGRRCYAMEIDPHYVDVAIRRWQAVTGLVATLQGSDMSFDQVAQMLV
jgi:DNA modification methylase